MKYLYFYLNILALLLLPIHLTAQHQSSIVAQVDMEQKIIKVEQELIYNNESAMAIDLLVLNDWNNAYSSNDTPLAKRFSDEFYRGFHLANNEERGSTTLFSITDDTSSVVQWRRPAAQPDLIYVDLKKAIEPHQKLKLKLIYEVKIPSAAFTKYGYTEENGMILKNWYLTPARFKNNHFVTYSNENLDDIANAISDFSILLKIPNNQTVTTDLNMMLLSTEAAMKIYSLSAKNILNFNLLLSPETRFDSYEVQNQEILTDLKEDKLTKIEQEKLIAGIVSFVANEIGRYPHQKIVITQVDYDRNPFYGLNQLPAFISPFSDAFTYELRFLKSYLNAYLKNSLQLDNRKESWIYDGIQVYTMMKYIETVHPNSKMLGSTSKFKLLKSYNLTNLDFNEQYSYFYMLMARKNLDQPLENTKSSLIKFNEQIASKYRAGLSLRFLNNYLEKNIVAKSIQEFYSANLKEQQSAATFEAILKSQSDKNIDWFFKTIIRSRDLVDYKFGSASKTTDSVSFTIKNRTAVAVPIPLYGLKNNKVVFKEWLEPINTDSVFTVARRTADKLVLNYKNEVPEYNLRNNWKSLNGFFPNNRPIKFVFMKDLEDPYYNQVLYVPTISYNLYDGLTPGLRLHNKTILEKPFTFDVNPSYSTKAKTISGSGSIVVNQNYRNSNLFNVRYSLSGSYFHYAPDATYLKINPTVLLRFREDDYRDNKKQGVVLRQVIVNKEQSAIVSNQIAENYSVFNARYFNSRTEIINHVSLSTDLQLAGKFGKLAAEVEYRKLFENNHQINLRFYAGKFLYNRTNSDYYSFALDRPTDYLFDYNYYGRSEDSGFFSQQLIVAEGGFKSKLNAPFANDWITSINGSYNLFNWFEIYADAAIVKNKKFEERFLYDSGIRLNFVPDYFEVYLPVYSSNGWEIGQNRYNEKIRFIITLSPKILINLFNRKWF
ncbi:aminopeptidase [Flavobacterium frigidarium]|uniref:aminopeptidase n=1 Tax=Flavobacterium frigidarium TaxID=99286 RepID=UPI0004010DFE|nr:aminopeptidase [Flavobacterium frigidarium]